MSCSGETAAFKEIRECIAAFAAALDGDAFYAWGDLSLALAGAVDRKEFKFARAGSNALRLGISEKRG